MLQLLIFVILGIINETIKCEEVQCRTISHCEGSWEDGICKGELFNLVDYGCLEDYSKTNNRETNRIINSIAENIESMKEDVISEAIAVIKETSNSSMTLLLQIGQRNIKFSGEQTMKMIETFELLSKNATANMISENEKMMKIVEDNSDYTMYVMKTSGDMLINVTRKMKKIEEDSKEENRKTRKDFEEKSRSIVIIAIIVSAVVILTSVSAIGLGMYIKYDKAVSQMREEMKEKLRSQLESEPKKRK